MTSRLFRSILDFCLPRQCPACRTGYESNCAFCPDCEQELMRLEQSARCDRCAMPLTLPGAPCAQCLDKGLSPFDQIICLAVLKVPLRSAIHRMKYQHRWALAERLADRLLARADVLAVLQHADVLVPVPLHRKRQIERGYNQAEVIARRLCRGFTNSTIDPRPAGLGYQRLCVVRAAQRIRLTETQTQFHSRAQRTENLKDAFALLDPPAIAGKHIVLVDDVLTTGATLLSLARTLKPAKPAGLSAIVLAVADPKGRAFEVI